MNVYMLRERSGQNYFTKTRKWAPKIGSAKIFTELGEARKVRAAQRTMMSIKQAKIEIVEFELSERAVL